MTSAPVRISSAIEIPELGPALGRIALAEDAGRSSRRPLSLDAIRLDLATAIFELAADARSWSEAGDRQAAVETLGPPAWLTAWENAVREASAAVADDLDRRINSAGYESNMPGRRLRRLRLSEAERRAVAARLGGEGVVFAEGLDDLGRETIRLQEGSVHDRESVERWRAALTGAARKLESAWLTLESAADAEWNRWSPLIGSVRSWRRPRWILWSISAIVITIAFYVGLVVGGYLAGPPFLDAFAEWWWNWWDRLVEPA